MYFVVFGRIHSTFAAVVRRRCGCLVVVKSKLLCSSWQEPQSTSALYFVPVWIEKSSLFCAGPVGLWQASSQVSC